VGHGVHTIYLRRGGGGDGPLSRRDDEYAVCASRRAHPSDEHAKIDTRLLLRIPQHGRTRLFTYASVYTAYIRESLCACKQSSKNRAAVLWGACMQKWAPATVTHLPLVVYDDYHQLSLEHGSANRPFQHLCLARSKPNVIVRLYVCNIIMLTCVE